MYQAPRPLPAGGMGPRSTSVTDPYGNYVTNEIPINDGGIAGGVLTRPTQQEVDLARLQSQNNNMERMADDYLKPQRVLPVAPAAPTGSFLDQMMSFLGSGKVGGSSSTTATSGDTSLAQNQGDTLGSFTNFINELLRTAMGGKTSSDSNVAKIGSDLIGSNTQAALANLGSKERAGRQDWVGNSFAALRPGFAPAVVPKANEVDTSLFTQGVPTDQIFGGGIGGADPLGVLGIPKQRPPKTARDVSEGLMSSGGVKRFDPYATA